VSEEGTKNFAKSYWVAVVRAGNYRNLTEILSQKENDFEGNKTLE
jgi:hypothetical protein